MNYLENCSVEDRHNFSIRLGQNAKRIPETGCLEWTGTLHKENGYGVVTIRRTDGWGLVVVTHRLSYELAKGPIPPGYHVCHRCDNRKCMEPEHLYVGSPAENSADMVTKGRSARGIKCARTKLTEAQVLVIRSMYEQGIRPPEIARRLSVGYMNVFHVAKRHTWKHLP